METVNTIKPRLDYIDVAKGIGILLVVLGHIVPHESRIGMFIYSFHMPLFFIISGILLGYNDKWKFEKFSFTVKRKAKSLLWPYLTFGLLLLSMVLIFRPQNFMNNLFLFFVDGNGGLWFLWALFISEVIFIYIMKNIEKYSSLFIIAFVILTILFSRMVSSAVMTNLDIYQDYSILIFNILNRALLACIFLFIGYYFYQIKNKVSLNKNKCVLLAVLCLIITLILSKNNFVDLRLSVISNPIIFYIAAILGSYSIIKLSEVILNKSKFLLFFGVNSLILYATHFYILEILKFLNNYFLIFIFSIILGAIVIILINRYFKFLINYNSFKNIFEKTLDYLKGF